MLVSCICKAASLGEGIKPFGDSELSGSAPQICPYFLPINVAGCPQQHPKCEIRRAFYHFNPWHPAQQPINLFLWRTVALVQLLSRVWLSATPQTAACQRSLSFTISQSMLKLHVHWVDDAIQPSHPLIKSNLTLTSDTFLINQNLGLYML